MRGRSTLALGIAVALIVLDGLFVMVSASQAGGTPPVGGIVAHLDGRWQPLRLFTTTLVNFAALGGEASTSRMDSLRRLARHVRERQPTLALDDDTLAFVEGKKPPARLVNTTQLAEYDSVYGPA